MAHTTIEDAYKAANTYEDMCMINVKFLKGVYTHTAYHVGPVNTETIPLLDDLCKLNVLGLYTYNGQPSSTTVDDSYSTNVVHYYQTRGYLDALIQNKYISMLKIFLDLHYDCVYYFFEHTDGATETNIPFVDSTIHGSIDYPLSRKATIITSGFTVTPIMHDMIAANVNMWNDGGDACIPEFGCDLQEQIQLHELEGVNPDVFNDCTAVVLVTRDYNSSVSLEKLMLEFFAGIQES
jgi:hypothetical protein